MHAIWVVVIATLLFDTGCGKRRRKAKEPPPGAKTEAEANLKHIATMLKAGWMTEHTFPVGAVPSMPPGDCCAGPNKLCPPSEAWDKNRIWSELALPDPGPGQFHYTYESDGKRATATAVGDLDCDGKSIAYKLTVTVENDQPISRLDEPNLDDD